ncbi:MAG: DNA-3-methyladenine glycosylase I [Cytophagales bacterium]|jgi:DNA-3-methyladenine glycosylase I|nr:DNA-3-methyladenine glycosylase I [Cytophagales bacterium]
MNSPQRCKWVKAQSIAYHDKEWGKPNYDDNYLFEILMLEGFQAGLSWECVLNKREAFRCAFDNFDYKKIAAYTPEKQATLLSNSNIIRHRLKIKAASNNAEIFMKIQSEYGSFANYIWHFTEGKQIINRDSIIRSTSLLSDTISKDLQKRKMKFVGSTIIYSYLQAIGIVDDHEPTCAFAKKN